MRKSIIGQEPRREHEEREWLDLETLARVEVSSEESSHPVESALQLDGGMGWRASSPGKQILRLLFDQPQRIKRIYLLVHEQEVARTQEFVLRWSPDRGKTSREIVRQQFNFNPPGTVTEREEFNVDLQGVSLLELEMVPDIGGSGARASLARFRIA